MKTVGFLYFSLYTQLWNEGQTWGCSRCPLPRQLFCYCELQTAHCFCNWGFTLALSVSLKEFTVSLKGPLEILDTNKLLKKYLTGEKRERFLVFARLERNWFSSLNLWDCTHVFTWNMRNFRAQWPFCPESCRWLKPVGKQVLFLLCALGMMGCSWFQWSWAGFDADVTMLKSDRNLQENKNVWGVSSLAD